jgi:hypothetical protein
VDPGPCRREGSGFFYVLLSLFKKCVLLTKVWRRRLSEDGIKSFPSSPCPGRACGGVFPASLGGFGRCFF